MTFYYRTYYGEWFGPHTSSRNGMKAYRHWVVATQLACLLLRNRKLQ